MIVIIQFHKEIQYWLSQDGIPLKNFLSKPSKHLTSISIQNEAKFLNPEERKHLSSAQLKQWKTRQEPEWTQVTSKTKEIKTYKEKTQPQQFTVHG